MTIIRNYIFISLLFLLIFVPSVSAANWTLNVDPHVYGQTMDIINSTYMKDWLYGLVFNGTVAEFPIIGFASSVALPFNDSFENVGAPSGLFYVVIWGLSLVMIWRNSGKVTLPLMIGVITAGAWGMLMPQWTFPVMLLLMCAALTSLILTFVSRE
jgi:hypothetical protein